MNLGGSGPTSVVAGDFNADGNVDVAVSNYDGHVRILLGQSKSIFGITTSYAAGVHPWDLAAADIDGNGRLDLIVVDEAGNTVSVLPGNGNGTFGAPASYTTGMNPVSVAAADFNGDGKLDLAVVNYADGTVSVLLGK